MSKTFEELMRSGYESVGLEQGSPFRLPLWLRRILAFYASLHPWCMALTLWLLHQGFGWGGYFYPNQAARDWCRIAREYTLAQGKELADAMRGLDRHRLFLEGARTHARNCSESMFMRSGYLDFFFRSVPLPRTETSDPHQRPYYLVPGIPSHRYYAREQFVWARALEESYATIRAELEELLRDPSGFGNYRSEFNQMVSGWNTYALWVYGQRNEQNAARCPKTIRLLESLPGFESGEWALFSSLNPKCRITAHVGPMNGILRGHLAMLVPEGCGLRVGGEDTTWREGEVLVFDDSFVHEVWNLSERVRIVLFLNFWHPCLGPSEREALSQLRQAYHNDPMGRHWREHQERPSPATL